MSQDEASKAKEKGNKLFKDGKVAESIKHYKEAERLDAKSPIYPSNLSAAFYELGDYAGCLDAILRSWDRNPETGLGLRLSTRLAKALSHGLQNGTISASSIAQNIDAIKELEAVSFKDESENAQAWKVWRSIRAGIAHHADLSYEAKVRLTKMPIYKSMSDPRLTYFSWGTDDVISLVDGWGPSKFKDPIHLQRLDDDQLSQLAFLVGGVGDGRHALGTIVGIGKAYGKLNPSQKKITRTHVTMLDSHSASIARNLIMLILVDMLMAENLDEQERLEIQATLIYTYAAWIMPSYCYDRLMKVCQDTKNRLLENPLNLPSWIHINTNSIRLLLPTIDYWLTYKKRTVAGIVNSMVHTSSSDRVAKMMSYGIALPFDPLEDERKGIERMIAPISDEKLMELLGGANDATRECVKMRRTGRKKELVDMLARASMDKTLEWGLVNEARWFKETHTFMPPAGLIDRHKGFEYYSEMIRTPGSHQAKLKEIEKSVSKTWKPNITMDDGTEGDKYLAMDLDAFLIVTHTASFNEQQGIRISNAQAKREWPTFAYIATFFDAVMDTLKALKGNFQAELISSEINQEMAKIRLGTDSRPEGFPKKFTRIWLSNIPDYTHGTLSSAIYMLPVLQDNMDSAVTANCLFNSPVWKNDDEFCYNYTMLLPKDLRRYLGVRTVNSKAVMDILTLAPSRLPISLSALASREQLVSWLARLLLSLVAPGFGKPRPNLVKLPCNLVAFIQLLAELRNIGYPSHWLSEFLQAVLSGTLQVDHLTYKGDLPRPVSELSQRSAVHRVRLDPWHAELEMILASSMHGLPFALQLPASFASSHDDIGLYKTRPTPNNLFGPRNQQSGLQQNDSVIAMLFYKKAADLHPKSVDSFLRYSLPAVVDGQANPPAGSFHVFTTTEFVDLTIPEVRWRMSKTLAAKMKREEWRMTLWRMDCFARTTLPSAASSWQIDDSLAQ